MLEAVTELSILYRMHKERKVHTDIFKNDCTKEMNAEREEISWRGKNKQTNKKRKLIFSLNLICQDF